MEFVPSGVSSCLYAGITTKIEYMKRQIEWSKLHPKLSTPDNYLEIVYKDIIEAVDWYNNHCVVSGKYLRDALDELTVAYEDYKK